MLNLVTSLSDGAGLNPALIDSGISQDIEESSPLTNCGIWQEGCILQGKLYCFATCYGVLYCLCLVKIKILKNMSKYRMKFNL